MASGRSGRAGTRTREETLPGRRCRLACNWPTVSSSEESPTRGPLRVAHAAAYDHTGQNADAEGNRDPAHRVPADVFTRCHKAFLGMLGEVAVMVAQAVRNLLCIRAHRFDRA